jgi:hypothetical protein
MTTMLLAAFILSGAGLVTVLLATGSFEFYQSTSKEHSETGKTTRRSSSSDENISSIRTTKW